MPKEDTPGSTKESSPVGDERAQEDFAGYAMDTANCETSAKLSKA